MVILTSQEEKQETCNRKTTNQKEKIKLAKFKGGRSNKSIAKNLNFI
jgi:hypothetical protein